MNNVNKILKKIIEENKIKSEKIPFIVDKIKSEIRNYVNNNGLKSLVLGVSGGLDSAVVAYFAQEKFTGVPLIGLSIPMNNTENHKEKAKWVGEEYCSVFEEFNGWDDEWDLDGAYTEGCVATTNMIIEIIDTISLTDRVAQKAGFNVSRFPKNVLNGNIKARMRMITLYDMARKTNGIVLSTDNYSEELMGFFTLNGDVGDYAPIQKIYKGLELPYIAEYVGVRKDIITQKPSDGLMVTEDNTDEAQLGATYPEVDAIMIAYMNNNFLTDKKISEKDKSIYDLIKNDEKVKNIVKRYESTEYKRKGQVNIEREDLRLN